ncbi:hypothetical protein Tco_0570513 [Tanacetum coccineum]
MPRELAKRSLNVNRSDFSLVISAENPTHCPPCPTLIRILAAVMKVLTMDITRDQQLALDDALVAPANQLKIGKRNLRLSSDLNSKEATLQMVYDVLKLTPFYKAF